MREGLALIRRKVALSVTGLGILAGLMASAQLPAGRQPLSEWMPAGALAYLESADFAAQLADWNQSEVRSEWLASVNHEQFLTTRLILKLGDVYTEFSEAAGFGPDLAALETVAGEETALALYDIGNLHFLYISRLPSARLAENVLTGIASSYQSQTAGGESYYVREAGERVSAFAIAGDHVLVSTREDLVVSALERMSGSGGPDGSVAGAEWYRAAFAELGPDALGPVPLRLVMDLPRVVETPYFRSYWIQKNPDHWRDFSAFLTQVTRGDDSVDEIRVFVRPEAIPVTSNPSAAAELGGFVPDEVGLYRLWDRASTEFAMDLLGGKFFGAGSAAAAGARSAPRADLSPIVGSVGDLRTRIDETPGPSLDGDLDLGPMEALVDSAGIEAILHLEASPPVDDGRVFVSSDTAVAFRAGSAWSIDEVETALTSAVASYQSVSEIGLGWEDVVSGAYTLSQMNGLLGLTVYVDGQTLWIARTPELLGTALATEDSREPGVTQPQSTFRARYSHRAELQPYLKGMRMLDLSEPSNYSSFFSENVGSLASVLDVIDSVQVTIDDDGRVQRHAVTYELSP